MRLIRQSGYALLSSVLAIATAALIVVWSIKEYESYKGKAAIEAVSMDLQGIWQVGMDYYTTVGCLWRDSDPRISFFAGNTEPSFEEIAAVTGKTTLYDKGRSPLVQSYRLQIRREAEEDDEGAVNGHYHLMVQANFDHMDDDTLVYWGKRLQATHIDTAEKVLIWDRLASTLIGSSKQSYAPLEADNIGDTQLMEQDFEKTSRHNCQ